MAVLLTDRMLEGLARRLRLLGYDCESIEIHKGTMHEIVETAREKGRLLISVSLKLHQMAPDQVILVPAKGLNEQFRIIVRRFPIDFETLAFTRCSPDNTVLEAVAFEEAAAQLPPLVREQQPDPVYHCSRCGRFYWQGTHLNSSCSKTPIFDQRK